MLFAHIMQIISAVSGGFTDLSFHAIGYTWQFINCFLTASYSVSYLVYIPILDTAADQYNLCLRNQYLSFYFEVNVV